MFSPKHSCYTLLTEGNITLNKDTTPTQTTAKALGINTDIAQANAQTETPKDINKQLDEQQQIATAAGHVKSAVETFVKNQRKEAEIKLAQEQSAYEAEKAKARAEGRETPKKPTSLETAEQNVKDWGTGGGTKRAIDALTHAGLIALSGGSAQSIATAATSPYVNQLIKDATKDYPALNIPTHILWGAVEAELMGGNAQTGAISTAAGELGAKYLTEHLYQKDAKDLTETERNQIKEMAKALAGVACGLSAAGEGASAVKILRESSIGAVVANNAVENNHLLVDSAKFAIRPTIKLLCSKECLTAIGMMGTAYVLSNSEIEESIQAGVSGDPAKIAKLSDEQRAYLNNQILSGKDSFFVGTDVWIPNADGGYSPVDPSLVTTTYGGKPVIDPRIIVNHTGGIEYPADYNLPINTGGNQIGNNDKDSHILVGGESQIGDWRDNVVIRDARLPIPEPVKANNGLIIESNSKHTLGGAGNRPNAGIEPKDSFKLFESSIEGGKKRYAIDGEGRVHQFNSNKEELDGIGLEERVKLRE